MVSELKLDIACGLDKREGFYGIDIIPQKEVDCVMDLQRFPWDIESNSAEEIYCGHFAEHIKHENVAARVQDVVNKSTTFEEFKKNINAPEFTNMPDEFVRFMNEVYRILKPGGKLVIVCPYYTSGRAYGDPTHTRYIGDYTFYYFNKEWRDKNAVGHLLMECDFDVRYSYGIQNEMTLKSEEVRNQHFLRDWNVIDDIYATLIKR